MVDPRNEMAFKGVMSSPSGKVKAKGSL